MQVCLGRRDWMCTVEIVARIMPCMDTSEVRHLAKHLDGGVGVTYAMHEPSRTLGRGGWETSLMRVGLSLVGRVLRSL